MKKLILIPAIALILSVGVIATDKDETPVDNQVRHVSEMVDTVETKNAPTKEPELASEPMTTSDTISQPEIIKEESPVTISDEDIFHLVFRTIEDSGYVQTSRISNTTILNAVQRHPYGSTTRYTEDELVAMTLKCVSYVQNNIDSYIEKYGVMADARFIGDAARTPCWLL